MKDHIVLTLPSARAWDSVVGLVLGGLGTRLDLPFERLDELQLAVSTALDALQPGGEVTLEAGFDADELVVRVGPFAAPAATSVVSGHVLQALADSSRATAEGDREWLELTFALAESR